jgi:hypothetical protein
MSKLRIVRSTLLCTSLVTSLVLFGSGAELATASPSGAPVTTVATTTYDDLYSITSDPAGNVYSVDADTGDVLEFPGGIGPEVVIGNDTDTPIDITYHNGLLYLGNDDGTIDTMSASGGALTTLISASSDPGGEVNGEQVIFDAQGDLFVANYSGNVIAEVPAGSSTEVTTGINVPVGCGPWDLLVQGSSLYITCWDSGAVLVTSLPVPGGGETPTVVTAPNLEEASGIAQDGSGNIYIGNYDDSDIVVLPTGGAAAYVLPTTGVALQYPWGLTYVNGNLYTNSWTSPNVIDQISLTPNPVTNLSVAQGSGSVTGTWVSSGAPSYICTLMFGFNDPSTYTQTTSNTTCTFSGLSPTIPYGISVVASNGSSISSAVVAFSVLASPPVVTTTTTQPPTTTTLPPPPPPKKRSILCVKGKHKKRVVAVNPRCPAGYKVKK